MAARSDGRRPAPRNVLLPVAVSTCSSQATPRRRVLAFQHVPLDVERRVRRAALGGGRAFGAIAGALMRVAAGLQVQLEGGADAVSKQRGRGERAHRDAVLRVAIAGEAGLDLESAGADDVARFGEVGAIGDDRRRRARACMPARPRRAAVPVRRAPVRCAGRADATLSHSCRRAPIRRAHNESFRAAFQIRAPGGVSP
jgi:hypothetical protein